MANHALKALINDWDEKEHTACMTRTRIRPVEEIGTEELEAVVARYQAELRRRERAPAEALASAHHQHPAHTERRARPSERAPTRAAEKMKAEKAVWCGDWSK